MANKSNMNLSIWENVRQVDRAYTKKITGKSYSGDSPNPTWVVMKATEVLGPVGQKWGWHVLEEKVYEGAAHQVVVEQTTEMWPPEQGQDQRARSKSTKYEILRELWHQLRIEIWQDVDGEIRTYEAFGGTQMFYLTRAGKWMFDEDAAKKSLTDAITKGLSQLGVAADLFLGLFDDKYQSMPETDGTPTSPAPDDTPKKTPAPRGEQTTTDPF